MNSRSKGQRGEREIVAFWREHGFPEAHRTPMSGGMQWKGDVQGVAPLHIEVKRNERLNVWEAMAQAERDCPEDRIPALHYRRNGSDWWLAMPLVRFEPIFRSWVG